MEKTVTPKQFAIIIFIVAVSSRIFMLPALILGISGRDSWLTLIMYYALDLLVLFLVIYACKKNPNVSVHEFLQMVVGKIGSKIIIAAVAMFYIFKATVMISEIKVFFTVTATENLNWQLCVIPLLVVLGLISLKSLRDIGRLGEIFIPFFLLSMVVIGLIMAKSTEFSNMLPLFENGISNNFHSLLLLPIWMMDFSVLTIFLGKIEHRKKLMRFSFFSSIISFAAVLYFNIIMYSSYSYVPKLLGYGHNITNMVLYPTGTYNYGRFDLIIFSVWMLGVLIHVSLLFYAACRHLSNITNIKNNYITALINMGILFVLIVFIFPDEQLLYSYSVSVFNYAAFAVEFLFPLLVFVSSIFYRRLSAKKRTLLKAVKPVLS